MHAIHSPWRRLHGPTPSSCTTLPASCSQQRTGLLHRMRRPLALDGTTVRFLAVPEAMGADWAGGRAREVERRGRLLENLRAHVEQHAELPP